MESCLLAFISLFFWLMIYAVFVVIAFIINPLWGIGMILLLLLSLGLAIFCHIMQNKSKG